MTGDVLVQVEGVSKKFCRSLKRSLWYGLRDVASELGGHSGDTDALRPQEFWAVNDVSFELRRGECLGLIGPNGAGKSTMLKMLNGLVKPDRGRITLRGRIGALIELGAGFNPILTARENIYVNGSVLGYSRREIDSKFDDIVEFAEIKEFIDTPVQNFSSGMQVRLGFAVAAQMEPDVLLIDEVLAVGDVGFRARCYEAIGEISRNSALIFVSHSMPIIARVCSSAAVMASGRLLPVSNPAEAVGQYYTLFDTAPGQKLIADPDLEIAALTVRPDTAIETGAQAAFELEINSSREFPDIEVNFVVLNQETMPVAQTSSKFQGRAIGLRRGKNKITASLDQLQLNPGKYSLSLTLEDSKTRSKLVWEHGAVAFEVKGSFAGNAPYQPLATWKVD